MGTVESGSSKLNLSSRICHPQGKLNHQPTIRNVLTKKVPFILSLSSLQLICFSFPVIRLS